MTLPNEVVELLRRAALHPDGPAPLFEANLESTASLYQVHPTRVEQVRGWLSDAQLRRESQQIIDATHAPAAAPAVQVPVRDADVLIAEAMATGKMELLMDAPVESAAILLGVHPFVIDEARVRAQAAVPAGVAVAAARPSSPRFAAVRPS